MHDALSVLACASCGAHVVVTRDRLTHCAHCGHDTEVPESYRAALDVAEREVQADALTQAAFEKLSAEPAWPLRAIGVISGKWWAILLLALFVFDVVIQIVDSGFEHIRPWLGINAWDWFTSPEQTLLVWGSSIFVMALLVVLGAFGLRRAADLAGLHAALAARPPDREGGPARCRECGAPLTISKNASGARCLYCEADNLVTFSTTYLARLKRATKKVAREAKQALADQRRELRKLRVRLAIRLAAVIAFGTWILSGPIRNEASEKKADGDLALRYALVHPRELFDQQIFRTATGAPPQPPSPTVPVDQCASTYGIHREDLFCDDVSCYAGWFVALRRGETLELTAEQRAAAILYAHNDDRGWIAAYGNFTDWGSEVARAQADANRPLITKAPYTSWYRIQIVASGVTDELSLCAKIDAAPK